MGPVGGDISQLGIFVGGASSRMGTPKGLLRYDDERLLDRALRLASSLSLEPVLVGDTTPYAGYDEWSQVLRCADEGVGPLAGLLALLRQGPALIVACDMPLIEPAHLQQLLDAPNALIALSRGEFFEPFPSRCGADLCSYIEAQLARPRSSFQSLICSLPVSERALVSLPPNATLDWDSPADVFTADR